MALSTRGEGARRPDKAEGWTRTHTPLSCTDMPPLTSCPPPENPALCVSRAEGQGSSEPQRGVLDGAGGSVSSRLSEAPSLPLTGW